MKPADTLSSERSPFLLHALQWLDDRAEALQGLCDRRRLLLLGVVSFVYFAVTSVLASRKPMWNDEFFTYFIAQAPTLSGIWSALLTGADQNPFPFYVLTRWSLALFGIREWALRLPEMVGVWVAGVCLFHVVARRSSSMYGFVAMMCLFVTGANFYSYEARPYGLALAFGALAWLCWQPAAEGQSRPWSLVGLWGSLSAAVSCHYYAVFVFVPLVIGELVRFFNRRRADWPMWLAIVSGFVPLLFFLPLIQRARTYATGFWAIPNWNAIPDTYSSLLMPAPLMLMLVLIFAGLVTLVRTQGVPVRKAKAFPSVPEHESAAALTYVAMPVVAVATTMLTTGAFTSRYALPTVLGVCVLIAWTSARILDGRPLLGMIALVLATAGFLMLSARSFPHTKESALGHIYTLLNSAQAHDLPIVVSDPHNFMMLAHYAPQDLSSRFVYLADPPTSLRLLGHNTMDRGVLDLNPWFRMNVQEAERFSSLQSRFLLYVHGGSLGGPLANGGPARLARVLFAPDLNWLLSDLAKADWHLELKLRHDNQLLFLATRDAMHSPLLSEVTP